MAIFSEFSDDNCQNTEYSWTHGWTDDRITTKGYRYMYYTTTHNPWIKMNVGFVGLRRPFPNDPLPILIPFGIEMDEGFEMIPEHM